MDETVVDRALIDEALDVVADASARAPRVFLLAAALGLAALGGVLLLVSTVVSGSAHDLLLNLASEVAGAWMTLVLIDGLWRRSQANADARLGDLRRSLEGRRDVPLSADERAAWRVFVGEYRSRIRGRSTFGALTGFGGYARELEHLGRAGNATLETYRPPVTPSP